MKVNVRNLYIVHKIFHINLNFFDIFFFHQNIILQIPQIPMVQLKNIPFDFEVKGQGYEWILVHSVYVSTFVSGQYQSFKKPFTFCNILCCLF